MREAASTDSAAQVAELQAELASVRRASAADAKVAALVRQSASARQHDAENKIAELQAELASPRPALSASAAASVENERAQEAALASVAFATRPVMPSSTVKSPNRSSSFLGRVNAGVNVELLKRQAMDQTTAATCTEPAGSNSEDCNAATSVSADPTVKPSMSAGLMSRFASALSFKRSSNTASVDGAALVPTVTHAPVPVIARAIV